MCLHQFWHSFRQVISYFIFSFDQINVWETKHYLGGSILVIFVQVQKWQISTHPSSTICTCIAFYHAMICTNDLHCWFWMIILHSDWWRPPTSFSNSVVNPMILAVLSDFLYCLSKNSRLWCYYVRMKI